MYVAKPDNSNIGILTLIAFLFPIATIELTKAMINAKIATINITICFALLKTTSLLYLFSIGF